jgi:hypothetical protein
MLEVNNGTVTILVVPEPVISCHSYEGPCLNWIPVANLNFNCFQRWHVHGWSVGHRGTCHDQL